MGHMLEQYGEMASFASLRQPAWHGLGTVFDEAVNTSEMLSLANLSDWNVRQEAITLPGRYHGGDFFANVRTNPFDGETDVLGDVVELLVVDRHVDEFLHLSLKSVKVSVSDTKSLTSLRHTTVGGLSVTNAETLFRRLATLANGKRQQDAGGSTRP